jgi:Zn-dependent peptidase ImmA (M78 family)
MFEAAVRLAENLRMPQLVIPSRLDGDPEKAAALLRSVLGISPNVPIKNIVESLERAGVFVFALPELFEGCDGFSNRAVVNDALVPVICLSASIPADRTRFTAIHEIGELTLADMPPGRERERKAHRFAGAFLMPPDAMKRDLIPPLTLSDFAVIRRRYGVAIQSAIVRARQLDIINEARYNSLFRQLSAKGMRTNEGSQPPAERPRAFRKMAELIYGDPIDFRRLGADLNFDPMLIRQVLGAHAPKPGSVANETKKPTPVVQLRDKSPIAPGSEVPDEVRV